MGYALSKARPFRPPPAPAPVSWLAGVTVLETARTLATAYASKLLVDLGAAVTVTGPLLLAASPEMPVSQMGL